MPKMIILRGLPGSGKSTWAKEKIAILTTLGVPVCYVNKDSIREKYPTINEKQVHEFCIEDIRIALLNSQNLIIDNTNLNQRTVNQYTKIAYDFGYDWEVRDFDTDLKTCLERNQKRGRKVPRSVIIRMAMDSGRYVAPKSDAYVFDLDGTLSDTSWRTHFVKDLPQGVKADWTSFFNGIPHDKPNKAVYDMYQLIDFRRKEMGFTDKIILVSGRPERYRKVTEEWLETYDVHYDMLFMRRDNDKRDDDMVKEQILHKYLKPNFNIKFTVDDRDRVVKMWRRNGITCFQAAEGNF